MAIDQALDRTSKLNKNLAHARICSLSILLILLAGFQNCSSFRAQGASRQTSQSGSSVDPISSTSDPLPTPNSISKSDLFIKTFGDPSNQSLVFVHGGPGSNAFTFEAVVAQEIANAGYFVVTYDQRGSGRSPAGKNEDFTFAKATQDLDDIIQTLGIKQPIIMGHSWGGTLTLKFLELHPGITRGAIILSSPLNYPNTFFSILNHSRDFYHVHFDFYHESQVKDLLTRMYPNGDNPPYRYSGADAGAAMNHAVMTGLMYPTHPTLEMTSIYARLFASPDAALVLGFSEDPRTYFSMNENIPVQDFVPDLAQFKGHVFAIYGDDDGLFSQKMTDEISAVLLPGHLSFIGQAAHYPFIDQRKAFLNLLLKDLGALSTN